MEDTSSFAQLTRLVPTANQEVSCRVENALTEPHKESYADYLVTRRGNGECECEKSPDKLAARDPDGWSDLGQYELGGKLADDIAGGPGHVDEV